MTAAPESPYERLASELLSWLGSDVAVVCSGVDGDPASLWPQERTEMARAIDKRQREFAAGRQAARTAMQRLGLPATAVPAHPDRSPIWPEGLVGSIAHSADTCVAVVGRRDPWASIGIDIEPDRGVDEPLWGIICAPDEVQQMEQLSPLRKASAVTRVFVAKEAFYKWHYPQHKTFLEFHDVSVTWAPDGSTFGATVHSDGCGDSEAAGHGRLLSLDGRVVACFASRTGGTAVPAAFQ